jgi:hypothetical protein
VGSDPDRLIEMNKYMEIEGFCSQVANTYWVVAYAYLRVAYASLARELYWALEVGLVLQALIKSYILGLTHDVDHFNGD